MGINVFCKVKNVEFMGKEMENMEQLIGGTENEIQNDDVMSVTTSQSFV